MGTGTVSSNSSPLTITFPFIPYCIFLPKLNYTTSEGPNYNPFAYANIVFTDNLETNSWQNLYNSANNYGILTCIKKSTDEKSYSFYWVKGNYDSGDLTVNDIPNISGKTYYFIGIGRTNALSPTQFLITSSTTFTVPYTGNYYLELYGRGGGCGGLKSCSLQGRSSCQSYDSISLTAGTEIKVTIGTGGSSTGPTSHEYESAGSAGTATTFGSYTVAGGGYTRYYLNGNAYTVSPRTSAGNKGTSGWGTRSNTKYEKNYNKGLYRNLYGYGGYSCTMTNVYQYANGGPRAVYLKYLG